MGEKIGIERIYLTRAVGPHHLCGHLISCDSWANANANLMLESMTAPDSGAYNKVDFTIRFSDGETYSGTYDLQHHSVERPDLRKHVRDFVTCYAGLMEMPAHMLEGPGSPHIRERQAKERWQQFLEWNRQQGTQEKMRELARRYDVGVEVPEEITA